MSFKEQCARCGKAVEEADCQTIYLNRRKEYVCSQCFADKENGQWEIVSSDPMDVIKDGTTIAHKPAVEAIREIKPPVPNTLTFYGNDIVSASMEPEPFKTDCPTDCALADSCKVLLGRYKSFEAGDLLNDIQDGKVDVPLCPNFPHLTELFYRFNTGDVIADDDVEMVKRRVDALIQSKEAGDWTPAPEQGKCERCGHEGFLPDGKHCSNCNQILLFQENQEKEEQRRKDENIPPVPPVHTCGYCEKPIPSDRVVRYRDCGIHGITLFLHEECAQAIAEKETEPLDDLAQDITEGGENSRGELHTFESGAVRYPTGTRYDLASPIAFKLCVDDKRIRALIWYLLSLHRKTEKADADRIAYVLFELLKEALQADKGTIIRLYAEALNEGAEKYPARNWEAGIPEENLVSHAVNHAVLLDRNDTAENHASHLVWNVFSIIHFRLKDKIDAILQA